MADPAGWIEKVSQRVLSWFSQREVKTPLAFYFRLIGAVVLLVIAALYLAPLEQRFRIFIIGVVSLGVLAVIVALFTFFNVKDLVYGESGHRAEMKFKFGTEKHEFGPAEVLAMPQSENPNPLPGAENTVALPGQGGPK